MHFRHTLAVAAMCALGPSICFAANGADAGAGGGRATKAKEKPAPAKEKPAQATPPATDAAPVDEPVVEAVADAGAGGEGGDPAAEASTADEAPSLAKPELLGFAQVRHPDGATGCSHDGVSYEADEDGVVTVPLQAVEALTSHGFELVR